MIIGKYTLEIKKNQIIKMPKAAKILSVQHQFDEIRLWAIIDPFVELEPRKFSIFATGEELPENFKLKFLYHGTALTWGGNYVWHVFEHIN